MENVAALLNVGDTRFPVEVQQGHLLNGDIAQAVQLLAVPHHLVCARAGLQLLPHNIRVGGFELVLLQHTRDDGSQLLCLCLVGFFTGQNVGFGISLDRICVFGHDDIVQPTGLALETYICGGILLCLFDIVTQLPPVFAGEDALLGALLTGSVVLQHLQELFGSFSVYRQASRQGDILLCIFQVFQLLFLN